ncbi:hypothetical protein [Alteromonas macleodii]|uniref:hypothetical protein n=1 Tax=Alteromonas macleodii TaxID=28108 RepID=UPI0015D1D6DF|nr:hypothetical protein [Alteromonas macleodii]
MAINTVVGLFSVIALFFAIQPDKLTSNFAFLPLIFILLVNALICILVYKNSFKALRFSTWFYVFQIFSFETERLSFYFNTGLQFTLSWSIGDSSFSTNFAVIAIWVLLYVALRSVKEQS